jgi:hypothetical protein
MPGYSFVVGLPGCRLPRGCGLGPRSPLALCMGTGRFIKRLFPLDRYIWGICPWSASDPFVEKGLAHCGWCRLCEVGVTPVSSLCRPCRVPATFNKVSVEGFCRLRRLRPPVVKMSAGCWRSRLLGRSRPPWPDVAVIPGTSAGRWLSPLPTQIGIPMTAHLLQVPPPFLLNYTLLLVWRA